MLTAESIDNYFQSRTQSSTQLSRTQGRARYTSTFTVEVRLKLYLSLTLNARFVSWCNEFYKLNQKKAKFYTKSCTIRQFTINTSNITEWVHVYSVESITRMRLVMCDAYVIYYLALKSWIISIFVVKSGYKMHKFFIFLLENYWFNGRRKNKTIGERYAESQWVNRLFLNSLYILRSR